MHIVCIRYDIVYLISTIIFIYLSVACWLLFCSIFFLWPTPILNVDLLFFFFFPFFQTRFDSITMMKVKLLSTMHLRKLNDASVFTLYAKWFADMTLCVFLLLCFVLNEYIFFFIQLTFLLILLFHFFTNSSIVTTMNINICCCCFVFFIRPIKNITMEWRFCLLMNGTIKCIPLEIQRQSVLSKRVFH